MILNAYFNNVLVYDVQNMLDVVNGEQFALEMDNGAVTVFTDNDPVLNITHKGEWIDVQATELGKTTIRIMDGTQILKDLIINIRESITRPATTLGLSLGEPIAK